MNNSFIPKNIREDSQYKCVQINTRRFQSLLKLHGFDPDDIKKIKDILKNTINEDSGEYDSITALQKLQSFKR